MGLELYLDLLSQRQCVYMFAFNFKPMELLKGLNIQEFSNINSLKKVPILKDGSFTLGESGLMENSKIMQESQESLGDLVVIPLFTGKPIPLQKLQEALDELNNSLKKFTEKFLQDKPFIVGSEISLADLVAITELMHQVEEAVGKELFQEVHERILNAQDLRKVQIDPQMKKEMKPLPLKMLK
ncbi:Glutathione S-transferase theta-1 [Chelonia mydas]|uniref:Glutathione S-transferase theta-1 n=1 Tax=Chelonia mydas TaxID=8469 RepID=M7B2L7_CHEMY|nr:Glutathione S-transferase theta-1 [Chelonia mydas]